MGELESDGATKKDHLEKVAAKLGSAPEELEAYYASGLPDELAYIWEYFCNMCQRRQAADGGGPEFISNQEVESWARLRGVSLAPWETAMLDRLERATVDEMQKQIKARLERLTKK